jgi:hypothetical protein
VSRFLFLQGFPAGDSVTRPAPRDFVIEFVGRSVDLVALQCSVARHSHYFVTGLVAGVPPLGSDQVFREASECSSEAFTFALLRASSSLPISFVDIFWYNLLCVPRKHQNIRKLYFCVDSVR